MTAFDRAWALVKMPIDGDSIRYDRKNDRWKAEFYDPDTHERLPMQANMYEGDDTYAGTSSIEGSIMGLGEDDPQRTHAFAERQEDDHYGNPSSKYQIKDVWTKNPHQRKGYAKALYDLIAYAISNTKEDYDLVGDSMQSAEAYEMWQKYGEYGSWPKDGGME